MTTPIYTINTPLINYYIYKNGPRINTPLANGKIYFWADADHSELADTYSDISDPENPVVNTNPIVLSAVGSCPPIYLQDIPYFILIESEEGGEDATINNYRGATFNQDTNNLNDSTNNLLANGQFSYPIAFSRIDEPVGTINDTYTNVALGWYFAQDDAATGNLVTFGNVSNEQIEGSPQFECIVTSTTTSQETTKYLAGIYGSANSFEGDELTFCIQLVNKNLSGTVPITISIEKNFGDGGSPTIITDIATFDVSGERTKFIVTFTNPSSIGSTIGAGNYAALRINYPLNQFFSVGATNALLQLGSFQDPIYIGQDFSTEVSQSLGAVTEIEGLGLKDNYSLMTYSDGLIFPLPQTGAIVLSAENIDFPDKLEIETPGQSLPVSGYSEKNIPFRRLYDVIGNTYGAGSGTLSVSSNGNIISFSSISGGRQNSNYTNGDIGPGFVVSNTVIGLKYGFNLELDSMNNNAVIMTWVSQFAANNTPQSVIVGDVSYRFIPNPSIVGNFFRCQGVWNPPVPVLPAFVPPTWGSSGITTQTINPGSISQYPSARITFQSEDITSYKTSVTDVGVLTGTTRTFNATNMLDFGLDATRNIRGNNGCVSSRAGLTFSSVVIRFKVDNVFGPMPVFAPEGVTHTIDFNMETLESLNQNILRFIREIANPFTWTIQVNVSPSAGQYFLFSDTTTDYYAWYRVNGSGVDPALPGRTGYAVDILAGDSFPVIAFKTAAALTATFNLPTPGVNLPALPDDSKTSYYINL